jgi:hypothetical protein
MPAVPAAKGEYLCPAGRRTGTQPSLFRCKRRPLTGNQWQSLAFSTAGFFSPIGQGQVRAVPGVSVDCALALALGFAESESILPVGQGGCDTGNRDGLGGILNAQRFCKNGHCPLYGGNWEPLSAFQTIDLFSRVRNRRSHYGFAGRASELYLCAHKAIHARQCCRLAT